MGVRMTETGAQSINRPPFTLITSPVICLRCDARKHTASAMSRSASAKLIAPVMVILYVLYGL
jgi:hypothetical protein